MWHTGTNTFGIPICTSGRVRHEYIDHLGAMMWCLKWILASSKCFMGAPSRLSTKPVRYSVMVPNETRGVVSNVYKAYAL